MNGWLGAQRGWRDAPSSVNIAPLKHRLCRNLETRASFQTHGRALLHFSLKKKKKKSLQGCWGDVNSDSHHSDWSCVTVILVYNPHLLVDTYKISSWENHIRASAVQDVDISRFPYKCRHIFTQLQENWQKKM